MARRWQPKYKSICPACGWSAQRTKFNLRKPCPKCKTFCNPEPQAITRSEALTILGKVSGLLWSLHNTPPPSEAYCKKLSTDIGGIIRLIDTPTPEPRP